jgi:anaerobic magnesium-protoporphyrin IX monomethyl ester cyclase
MKKASCISIDLINADKPPASLAFLAGACESAGYDYQCVSLNSVFLDCLPQEVMDRVYTNSIKAATADGIDEVLGPVLEQIADSVKKYNPDVVLVSVFSFMQQALATRFLEILRRAVPSVEIIAGGPGVPYRGNNNQTFGATLLAQSLIDFYCLGEGDVILPEFLKGNRTQLGLNSKDYIESWVPQLTDLDTEYLLPSYKKINTEQYHNLEAKDTTVFSISTSRGCVRDCSFCDVSNTWKKFKYRSGKHVASEILKHHLEVGAVHFTIVDSLINGSLKSFREFNEEMVLLKQSYSGLEKFSYNGMFIVRDSKSHNENLFRTMKDAGCESLAIGVETGSDRLRFEMNKKFTNEDLDYHLEMSSKYGIKNTLLMFVAYPTETDDDFEQSLRMLERYQKYLINDTILGINHSGVFAMIDDTPVFNNRHELGIVVHNTNKDPNASRRIDWVNTNNPSLTAKERIVRDITFRQRAAELRYPVPYANRYMQYLKELGSDFASLGKRI